MTGTQNTDEINEEVRKNTLLLAEAIDHNNKNMVKEILENGIGVDYSLLIEFKVLSNDFDKHNHGTTFENIPATRLMNTHITDNVLMRALYLGHTDIANELVTNGAPLTVYSKDYHPLHIYVKAGSIDHIKSIILLGISIESKDHLNQTPLLALINDNAISKNQKITIAKCLLQLGANPNAEAETYDVGASMEGEVKKIKSTCLSVAVKQDFSEMVLLLMSYGAKPYAEIINQATEPLKYNMLDFIKQITLAKLEFSEIYKNYKCGLDNSSFKKLPLDVINIIGSKLVVAHGLPVEAVNKSTQKAKSAVDRIINQRTNKTNNIGL